MKKELGIFVLLIVLCIIVSIINPNFLLSINLQNLARQIGADLALDATGREGTVFRVTLPVG